MLPESYTEVSWQGCEICNRSLTAVDIHISNIAYQMQNFSDEQLQNTVSPQSHIVPPLGRRRPPYLVSRQEWLIETFMDQEYRGQIVPQILDFGAGKKAT